MTELRAVARRSARALPVDDEGRLLLIRRTRSGCAPYYTTAGGGIDSGDLSAEAAMHRELFEELGAKAAGASQVLLVSSVFKIGLTVQHFFVTRLLSLDVTTRTGPEVVNQVRGTYDPEYFSLRDNSLAGIDLHPPELKAFLLANREAVLTEVTRLT
jgi:8-oxo-dGTP pyrophosphatase MutT (NUDIX family)